MPVQLPFTTFLNHYFASLANAVLSAVHVHPRYPNAPINDAFAMELIVVAVLLVFFILVRSSLDVEKPGALQLSAEAINEFVDTQAESIIGHGYQRFVPYCTCVALFVLLCNLLGLFPTLMSPTAKPWVPLGIALPTFLYYNYYGVREQGIIGYLKHFMGPVPAISPLMFPLEVVSHLARVLSLTVRLYANMFAGDMITLVAFSLIPIGVPAAANGLHLAVSFIQAYIFMLLAMIYLGQATAHDH